MSTARAALGLPAGTVLDRYRVEKIHTAWGFCLTYLASDTANGSAVAVHELLPEELVARAADGAVRGTSDAAQEKFAWAHAEFLREGRGLMACAHPAVQKVRAVFEAHGTAYWVTPRDEPRTAKSWLQELGRAPTETELRRFLEPLLAALAQAHAAGLPHLNLKPDSIQLTADGAPVLTHFAGARQAIARRCHEAAAVTGGYSPPEQYALEKTPDARADLYGLAAVAHRALTGEAPPDAERRMAGAAYRPLVERCAGRCGRKFLAAIDAALALDPAARPPSVRAWQSLLATTAGDGVTDFLRRHPRPALAGAAACAVALWFVLRPPPPHQPDKDQPAPEEEKKAEKKPAAQDEEKTPPPAEKEKEKEPEKPAEEKKKAGEEQQEKERMQAEEKAQPPPEKPPEDKAAQALAAMEKQAQEEAARRAEAAEQAEAEKRAAEEAARTASAAEAAPKKAAAEKAAEAAAKAKAEAEEAAQAAAAAKVAAAAAAAQKNSSEEAAAAQALAEKAAAEKQAAAAAAQAEAQSKQAQPPAQPAAAQQAAQAQAAAEKAARARAAAEKTAAEKTAATASANERTAKATAELKTIQAKQAAEKATAAEAAAQQARAATASPALPPGIPVPVTPEELAELAAKRERAKEAAQRATDAKGAAENAAQEKARADQHVAEAAAATKLAQQRAAEAAAKPLPPDPATGEKAAAPARDPNQDKYKKSTAEGPQADDPTAKKADVGRLGSAMAGVWQTTATDAPGKARRQLTLYDDGRYQLTDNEGWKDHGDIIATNGRMQMRSDATGQVVHSSFTLRTLSKIVTAGALGDDEWQRVKASPGEDPANPRKAKK